MKISGTSKEQRPVNRIETVRRLTGKKNSKKNCFDITFYGPSCPAAARFFKLKFIAADKKVI